MKNQKGQALVESLLILGLLFGGFFGCGAIGYLGLSRSWLRYQADQVLICAAAETSHSRCLGRLRQAMSVLPWGHVRHSCIRHPKTDQWEVEIQWQTPLFPQAKPIQLNIRRTLSWDSLPSHWRW